MMIVSQIEVAFHVGCGATVKC